MKYKATNQAVIESAVQLNKSKDLQLLGHDQLEKSFDYISNHNKFFDIFGLDNKFFYHAEKIVNNIPVISERGIGYLRQDGDNYFIVREKPIVFYTSESPNGSLCYNGPVDFSETIVVSSTIPHSHIESFPEQHCVITADIEFGPKPLVLDNNSFLARLDGDIESISFHDIAQYDVMKDNIAKSLILYTKQLNLSSSKLSMKNKNAVISSSIFNLNPTSDPPAKRGTLIYDEQSDTLRYYTGSQWRTLAFVEELPGEDS